MLLETTHSTPPGRSAADTALAGEQSIPAAGPHSHGVVRGASSFSPSLRAALREPFRWLVGLPFHSSDSRVTWLYYVIDEAGDVPHAVHAALERANSVHERQARGGMPVEIQEIEVQRVIGDAVGHLVLDRCA